MRISALRSRRPFMNSWTISFVSCSDSQYTAMAPMYVYKPMRVNFRTNNNLNSWPFIPSCRPVSSDTGTLASISVTNFFRISVIWCRADQSKNEHTWRLSQSKPVRYALPHWVRLGNGGAYHNVQSIDIQDLLVNFGLAGIDASRKTKCASTGLFHSRK